MELSPHLRAVLQALLVAFLWSTSWVLIKWGLQDIPALTFAGLRYALAFLCLLPFALRPAHLLAIRALPPADWKRLLVLGLLFVSVTQGAQFLALANLPAATVSLILSFSPALVALLGILFLAETPTRLQWSGVLLFLAGAATYFYPVAVPAAQALGFAAALVGLAGTALSGILGRSVNRSGHIDPLVVTALSMGAGSTALLAAGFAAQGLPSLSPTNWLTIAWLAVVNTALAFPLWNRTLRTLSAVESSVINNTMLVQIAVLAWLFLGEGLTWRQIAGLSLAMLGVLVVQLCRPRPSRVEAQSSQAHSAS